MDELQNQGLQSDGNSPEPSQNLEGNNPDPSQEDSGQLTDEQLEQMLPEQDERGVPAQNVLGEMRRKMDEMKKEFDDFKASQSNPYQQPPQYQQPNFNQQAEPRQPQQQNVIPRNAEEAAQIIDKEVREKFGAKMGDPSFDPLEMLNYQNRRMMELNTSMMQNYNSTQMERNNSETRIKNSYPDLNNPQSVLVKGVINEINRRAYIRGISPQQLYEQDPYIFESVTPFVASQNGITAKTQNQVRLQPKPNGMPPNTFPGRQTLQPEENKPTQKDVDFGKRFGVKAKTMANLRKNSPDPKVFVDDGNSLLS